MTSLFKYWEKDFNKKDFLKKYFPFLHNFIFELNIFIYSFVKYFRMPIQTPSNFFCFRKLLYKLKIEEQEMRFANLFLKYSLHILLLLN